MSDTSFRLRKKERLCSKKQIGELFEDSNSFFVYPFRVIWRMTDDKREYPVQFAISVGKKRIRRAVKRNYLKRRIKEAYRLNKHLITDDLAGKSLDMMLVYMTSDMKEFSDIEPSMIKLLKRMKVELLAFEDKQGK